MNVDLDRKQLPSIGINPNRHRSPKTTSGALAAFVVFLLAASSASSASLNVVGGRLFGASGVNVGGSLYDVEFVDGTCIAVFDGCDSAADFAFATSSEAIAAGQSLMDQVFVDGPSDDFDSFPELTFGCGPAVYCQAQIPFKAQWFRGEPIFRIHT